VNAVDETRLSQPLPDDGRVARIVNRLAWGLWLPLLVAVLFVVTWTPRFFRSFWGDETGTFWMVHEGFTQAIQKAAHWPGQSILYSAIASFFCFEGSPYRDALLRIPSLIGLGVACYFLFRLAEKFIGRAAGLTAITLFLFHPAVLAVGFQARPYSLAMAAVTASCWALSEWARARSRFHLAVYVFTSALIIYLHYLFAIVLVFQCAYLAYVVFVERRAYRFYEIGAAVVGSVALTAPLLPSLRLLVSVRQTLKYVSPPSIATITDWLAPSPLMAGLLIMSCVLLAVAPFALHPASRPSREFLVLTVSWWLLGPLVFCAISSTSTMRIFLPRYLCFSVPAQSLFFAFVLHRVAGASRARICALGAVLLFAANPLLSLRAKAGALELLPVIRIIRSEPNAPVFFPSLFMESLTYDWKSGNQPGSFLFATLVAYPIANTVIPLPVHSTDEAREFADHAIEDRLNTASRVLFVDEEQKWEGWIVDRMRRAGYKATSRPAGNFTVFEFTR
jgi:hypothetical protein